MISKIKIRKTSVERKKTLKYKTKQKNEKTTINDMFFLCKKINIKINKQSKHYVK